MTKGVIKFISPELNSEREQLAQTIEKQFKLKRLGRTKADKILVWKLQAYKRRYGAMPLTDKKLLELIGEIR